MLKRTFLVLVIVAMALTACGGGGGGTGGGAGNATNGDTLFHQATVGKNNAPGCVSCHSTEAGKTVVGPSLAGIGTQAAQIIKQSDYKGSAKTAEDYIRESIVSPNTYVTTGFSAGIMYQDYGKDLSGQQVNDLVAYLMSLK